MTGHRAVDMEVTIADRWTWSWGKHFGTPQPTS